MVEVTHETSANEVSNVFDLLAVLDPARLGLRLPFLMGSLYAAEITGRDSELISPGQNDAPYTSVWTFDRFTDIRSGFVALCAPFRWIKQFVLQEH